MTSDNERALKAMNDMSREGLITVKMPNGIESSMVQGQAHGVYLLTEEEADIIRTALQRDDSVVEEVAISALAGDMVNALCDYKILEGNFGDTAARIIISRLALKYPDGLKISEELNDRKS